jgi:hypothetical protein
MSPSIPFLIMTYYNPNSHIYDKNYKAIPYSTDSEVIAKVIVEEDTLLNKNRRNNITDDKTKTITTTTTIGSDIIEQYYLDIKYNPFM